MEAMYTRQLQQLLLQELPDSTILITTHDDQFAQQCDQVIRLNKVSTQQ